MSRIFLMKLVIFVPLLILFGACQEYTHDSFDTFSGQIVDQNGDPLPNFKLNVFRNPSEFGLVDEGVENLIYTLETDAQGKVRFVLPSRNQGWYLESASNFLLEYEIFENMVMLSYLALLGSDRDENGRIDFGIVKAIPQ